MVNNYSPTFEDMLAVLENNIKFVNSYMELLYNSTGKQRLLRALESRLLQFTRDVMETQGIIEKEIDYNGK